MFTLSNSKRGCSCGCKALRARIGADSKPRSSTDNCSPTSDSNDTYKENNLNSYGDKTSTI